MSDVDALLGQVVLGEHEVLSVARASAELAVLACRSTLDQRAYTVALAPRVAVGTSASALASAVERAGRHAIGERNLLALLSARVATLGGRPCIAVVRRGDALPSAATWLGRARTPAEVALALAPVAGALGALHEQGMAHGAVSLETVVVRDGALALDLFGLAQVAEAADGARGIAALFAPGACPPELADGALPGPWSDVYGLATVALALLRGVEAPAPASGSIAGAGLGERHEDLLRLALARSPSPRPTAEVFLRGLAADGAAPHARASAPQREPSRTLASEQAPRPGPKAPLPAQAPPGDGARVAWGVAAVLGVFALALGGALAWVLSTQPSAPAAPATSASTSASVPSPVAPPPLAPSAPTVAPPPGLSAVVTGNPAYPDDASALVPVESDAVVRGDRDALVTLIVFGDLTCPFTARLLAEVPALEARFGATLRTVWKSYPSPTAADALHALEAALLVRDKRGDAAFWRFVEASAGRPADAGRLEELGIKAGLDAGAVTRALAARPAKARIERDVELARRLGVRGTPVSFVNGRRLDGAWGHDVLGSVIEAEATRARAQATRVPREKLYAARVIANVTTVEGER